MSEPKQVVLASNNQHKLKELKALLGKLPIDLVPQSRWHVPSPAETGSTFFENALIKARHACSLTHLPAIADDSGLVIPRLDGEPGVRSARYAGEDASDAENYSLVLSNLVDKQETFDDCRAYFCATLVYLSNSNDPTPVISTGIWHGRIIEQPRGSNGFGYDPVFLPIGMACTAAELDASEKNRLSHRARATLEFVQLLEKRLNT